MSDSASCAIRSDLREIGKVHDVLESFCTRHEIHQEAASEMDLAIEEVLANVVNHAYRGNPEREIRVRIQLQEGQLVAEVEDDGAEFNPLKQEAPDLDLPIEDRPIGGLGIHLVLSLMDAVEYRREDGVNRLVMKKQVRDPA